MDGDAASPPDALLIFARELAASAGLPVADVLSRLLEAIESTRAEIAAVVPQATAYRDLPAARREIEAAGRDLSDAVERIMASVDDLLGADAGDPQAYGALVLERALQILENCIVHDLVGQRLTKVAGVIELVEARLGRLAERTGVADADLAETAAERRSRLLILNGPQLAGPATSQSDIDRLFEP